MVNRSITAILAGIVIYNRTYLNQRSWIKNNGVSSIKILQAEEAWMTGIVLTSLHCSLLVPKYLGLGQDGNTNSGIIFLTH
jgi:hypothetical protein